MAKKFKLLFVLILLLGMKYSQAQRDTLFWFVAPEVTSGHGDEPILFRLSAFEAATTVTIEQPANPNFVPYIVNIPANGAISIDVTPQKEIIENKPAATVLPYGIRIRATEPIFAYYEVAPQNNPDLFALKGRNALGNSFFIPMQNTYNNRNAYTPPDRMAFDIVATEDNTTVNVVLTNNAFGHPFASGPFQVTLNKGQTYSLKANSHLASQKLNGSVVTSDKPIAITVSDDSVDKSGPHDLAGDQIVPIPLIGDEYIVVKGFLTGGDHAYVLATQNNTQIFIDGSATPIATINAGQTYNHNFNGNATFVKTSNPSYVFHLTGYGNEVGGALIPQINCTGSRKVNFVRSTGADMSLIIFTRNGNQGGFVLNGNAGLITAAQFTPVPGNPDFVYARVTLNTTQVPVGQFSTLTNSLGVFHMGLINNSSSGGGCRYGYFSDFRGINFDFSDISNITCPGGNDGSIIIEVDGGTEPYQFLWNTGATTNQINNLEAGNYQVIVTDANGCIDSFAVQITEPAILQLNIDSVLNASCFGLSDGAVFLGINGGTAPYNITWNTGSSQNPLSGVPAGNYSVQVVDANNCEAASITASVGEPPQILINISAQANPICPSDTVALFASGADSFTWSLDEFLSNNQGDSVLAFPPTTTSFTITGTNSDGCNESVSFELQIFEVPPHILNVELRDLCFSNFEINAIINPSVQIQSWLWDFGDGSPMVNNPNSVEHQFAEPGIYNFTIITTDQNGCGRIFSSPVPVNPTPSLDQILIPNIITPNGDGVNDIWDIDPEIVKCYEVSVFVYNRWGRMVFESSNANSQPFAGLDKSGNQLTEGIYFYVIRAEGFDNKGTITIVR